MDMYSRLVEAGIRPDCAANTVAWYRHQGDDHGLELYVAEAEARAAARKEFGA